MNPAEAKRVIRNKLHELRFEEHRLSARTIDFTDLARGSCIFVKIHGWKPHYAWRDLQAVARQYGFRVEA